MAKPDSVNEFPDQVGDQSGYRLLGARLQELRRMRGMSLKEVASAVGVSASFLSMLERGQTDLSLSRFSRLAEFYKLQPSELLMELNGNLDEPEITSLDAHRSIARGPGVEYRVLQDENPQMIHVRIEPGARFADMRSHRGTDFWCVLEGAAQLHYAGRTYDVARGETVRFSSTVPHGFANPHAEPTELVALCSVPLW